MYKKFADSGDVVIQEQDFSIVGTHGPAIAMPLFCLHPIYSYSHGNQICLVGRHREVRPFFSPGVHHITSLSGHCGMSRNERHTSTLVRFVSSESGDNALSPAKLPELRSIGINIQGRLGNGEQVKEVLKYGGRCDGGHDLQV